MLTRHMSSRASGLAIVVAGLAASGWGAPVAAQTSQEAPATASSSTVPANTQTSAASAPFGVAAQNVDDIVVTAQKRTERLQDVPLAVTAVGAPQLAQRQINDTNNLVKAIPSLNYQQGNNPTNTTFRVRGIGTALFGQGVEPSVSVVVDGVVAARQAQSFADFADLERIEVLRGPQGTLFGKNSTGGVINVVTARPSRTWEANGEATIAEENEYRVKGSVSGPLTDELQFRLTGYYNNVGGYERDVATNTDYAGSKGYGVRGKLQWEPSYNLTFLGSADYRSTTSQCCRGVLVATSNPTLAALYRPVVPSFTNRSIDDNVPSRFHTDQQTYSLQGDWDLGGATVTAISAFQVFNIRNHVDADGINTPSVLYVGPSGGPAYGQFDRNEGQVHLDNVTQELRVASSGERRLTYVAGAYYSHLTLDRGFQRRRGYCAAGTLGQPCAVTPTFQSASSEAHLKQDSISAFGQLEYRVVGGLKAIGGWRLTHEKIAVAGLVPGPEVAGDVFFPGSTLGYGKRSAADTSLTGKAGLQYEFSRRAQVYGTYTRGYKGLGFDTEITANFARQNPVLPEYVNAYEVGFKGSTGNGLLSLNAALFRADYTNLQVQANASDPVTGSVVFIQTNAGTSRTEGFELESSFRPTHDFSLTAAVTYAKATINIDGLNCPLQLQAAAPVLTGNFPINQCYIARTPNAAGVLTNSPAQQNVRDGSLPASPRWRISASPRFDHELGSGNLAAFLEVDVNYTGRQNFAVEQDPLLGERAYTLVDLSTGVHTTDGRWTVTFFVKNLFDKNYYSNIGHGAFLATTASPNDLYANFNKDANRYVGGTLGFRFH